MLHLRKGKKEIIRFESLYEFADRDDMIKSLFGPENADKIQRFVRQNAFAMAISGARLRLGGGYIIEKC